MGSLQIKVDGDQVRLDGDVSYQTVVSALNTRIFSDGTSSTSTSVDFSGVKQADSACLALMLHWQREAKKQNRAITFTHIPKKLIALAEMSNLEKVLPIS